MSRESGKAQPDAPRPIAPEVREAVSVAANRCPYCRTDVEQSQSVACQACLTRHHAACWSEAGHCSSCKGTVSLSAQTPSPNRRSVGWIALAIAVVVLSGMGVLLAVLADPVNVGGTASDPAPESTLDEGADPDTAADIVADLAECWETLDALPASPSSVGIDSLLARLGEVLEQDPSAHGANLMRGFLHARRNNLGLAHRDLDAATQAPDGLSAQALLWRAEVELRQRSFAESRKTFGRVLKLPQFIAHTSDEFTPIDSHVYAHMGRALVLQQAKTPLPAAEILAEIDAALEIPSTDKPLEILQTYRSDILRLAAEAGIELPEPR